VFVGTGRAWLSYCLTSRITDTISITVRGLNMKYQLHHDLLMQRAKSREKFAAVSSAAGKKKRLTPEHKEKLRIANTGRKMSDATRAKISASHKGKPGYTRTPEIKEKMRVSLLAYHAKQTEAFEPHVGKTEF